MKIMTHETVEKEQQVFVLRSDLVRLRDSYDQTLTSIRQTSTEFGNLVRSFSSLSKCAQEFDDQQLRGLSEDGPQEAKATSFGALKQTFGFSAEQFELLTLEFNENARYAESGYADVLEVIGAIDAFLESKDEMFTRLWANLASDERDPDNAVGVGYSAVLTTFVSNVERFLAQSSSCFGKVLEDSTAEFQKRVDQLARSVDGETANF